MTTLRGYWIIAGVVASFCCCAWAADLAQGTTAHGVIAVAGQSDSYTFEASADSRADITVTTTSGSLSPVAWLYGPDGAMLSVGSKFVCGDSSLEWRNVRLAANGTYTLVVQDCSGANEGSYDLRIEPASTSRLYVSEYGANTVGEYNATTGAAINASLITGLNGPCGIALSGNNLFVVNIGGTVGKYNATTGAAINANLITGLDGPIGLALSDGALYVASSESGVVGKYKASTGAAINANFITGLGSPERVEVSGNTLYIVSADSETIGTYNATTGAPIDTRFLPLSDVTGLVVSGSTLYVSDYDEGTPGGGSIGTYSATTGVVINSSFITGLSGPEGLKVLGKHLFVANWGEPITATSGSVGEYNASTGVVIKANFVTGLYLPFDFATTP